MALKHPKAATGQSDDLSVAPIFSLETDRIPRHSMPEATIAPDVAYQIVHDELMLDGNARMNWVIVTLYVPALLVTSFLIVVELLRPERNALAGQAVPSA